MILLDGHKLSEFNLTLEEGHDHPATPIFQNKTLSIPGRPGQWFFGSELKEKPFNFPLATQGRDRVSLQRNLNKFVEFLFDSNGQPRELKLSFDYEPDKFYTVTVSDSFSPERVQPFSRFNLPLVAYDSFKRLIVDADEITWGSELITFNSTTINFGHTVVSLQEITRPQTLKYSVLGKTILPTFHIIGTANGLTISSNGKSFSLSNFSNVNWVIDGSNYTVKRNGIDTILDNVDFIEFSKGENDLQITGSNMNFTLSTKYKDKFL